MNREAVLAIVRDGVQEIFGTGRKPVGVLIRNVSERAERRVRPAHVAPPDEEVEVSHIAKRRRGIKTMGEIEPLERNRGEASANLPPLMRGSDLSRQNFTLDIAGKPEIAAHDGQRALATAAIEDSRHEPLGG